MDPKDVEKLARSLVADDVAAGRSAKRRPVEQISFQPVKATRAQKRIIRQARAEASRPVEQENPNDAEDVTIMGLMERLFRGHLPRLRLPRHVGTGWEFASTNPFASADVPDIEGPVIGLEQLSGGRPFRFNPFTMYLAKLFASQSVLVKGGIGGGKSFFVKRVVYLLTSFDPLLRAINTSDLKGEHGVVALALGGQVFKIGHFGSGVRINPLDAGPQHSDESDHEYAERVLASRLALLEQIASLASPIPLLPADRAMLAWALEDCTERSTSVPTLPKVVDALKTKRLLEAREGSFTREEARQLIFRFDPFFNGPLLGLFDGESTISLDPDCPYTVFDTFAMEKRGDLALSITQAITNAWVMNTISDKNSGRRYLLLREEGWRDMKTVQGLEAHELQLKLSREYGISMWMIVHEGGDFESIGDVGSKERSMAEKIARQYAQQVIFPQTEETLESEYESKRITARERDLISGFAGADARLCLLKTGRRHYVIDTSSTSSDWELELFETDRAIKSRREDHIPDRFDRVEADA